MFKLFYVEAGIDTTGRNISNHAGRVTCCTCLYNESNHKSNDVRTYQREEFKIFSDITNTLRSPASASSFEKCDSTVVS